jgi:hypothetical protein
MVVKRRSFLACVMTTPIATPFDLGTQTRGKFFSARNTTTLVAFFFGSVDCAAERLAKSAA